MSRFPLSAAILCLAALVFASAASAATPRPTITSFSPSKVRVGQTLVLTGKNFARGARNNDIFFRRGDGKTVQTRAKKATTRRIEVVVPSRILNFLVKDNTVERSTRFQIRVVTKAFGPYTTKSRSPFIIAAAAPTEQAPGSTPVGTTPPPPADCDTDGSPDTEDADDDNDLLTDDTERAVGLDICKKDTDGDGNEDGWEYFSAIDLNSTALPYPGKRPYPNPLDGADAAIDFDRDGLKAGQEFAAWAQYGSRSLPLNYSDGDQTSVGSGPPPAGLEYMDLDGNGTLSDDEKDVDGDGLPNYLETAPNNDAGGIFKDIGGGVFRATGNTFAPARLVGEFKFLYALDFLSNDTDGDTLLDGPDDQDHDGLSNVEEITLGGDGVQSDPLNTCDPSSGSPFCPRHPNP